MENFNKFNYMEKYGYEQMVFFHDQHTGLKAITAIHNTVNGPALGGSRFWNYANEDEAMEDALRLAKGMTYKNSIAGLPLGGGKTVIWGDVEAIRKDPILEEAFWRSFGRYIEGLNGRYITAADMNTRTQDMVQINKETKNVVGLPGKSGNPSPYTALGVLRSMQACVNFVYGSDDLSGKVVAIQGLGAVGYSLAEQLHEKGAKLIVTDINETVLEKAKNELGATVVGLDDIHTVEADIYAPCARGAVVNPTTIPQIKAKIICGSANNVLAEEERDGKLLVEAGLIYAPDYLANAGGVINVAHELREGGYNEDASIADINGIYGKMLTVLNTAKESGKPTFQVANEMAEERIARTMKLNSIYTRPR